MSLAPLPPIQIGGRPGAVGRGRAPTDPNRTPSARSGVPVTGRFYVQGQPAGSPASYTFINGALTPFSVAAHGYNRNAARTLAAEQLAQHPEWYDTLPAAALLESLSNAPTPTNPLDAAPDQSSRVLLARTLQDAEDPETSNAQSMTERVENALETLRYRQLERRQRELRTLIAEADRRADHEMLTTLTAEKLQIDRKLREQ